jgi:glutaredoxin
MSEMTSPYSTLLAPVMQGEKVLVRRLNADQFSPRSELILALLRSAGVEAKIVDVEAEPDLAQMAMRCSGCNYIPQLFYRGEFIGGASIVYEFLRSGEHLRCGHPRPSSADRFFDYQWSDARSGAVWRFGRGPGMSLVSCSARGQASVLSATTVGLPITHQISDGWINAAASGPDNHTVFLATTDAEVLAYDLRTRAVKARIPHRRWVNDIIYIPNTESIVSVDGGGYMTEVCARTFELLRTLKIAASPLWVVAADAGNGTVAAGDGAGILHIIDQKTWSNRFALRVDEHCVTSIDFSEMLDAYVAIGFGGYLTAVRRNVMLVHSKVHKKRAWSVVVLNNGRLVATTSADDTVRVHSGDDLTTLRAVFPMRRPIALAACEDDRSLLVGDETGRIHIIKLSDSLIKDTFGITPAGIRRAIQ